MSHWFYKKTLYASVLKRVLRVLTDPRIYHKILILRLLLVFVIFIDLSKSIRYFSTVVGTSQFICAIKIVQKCVLLPASFVDKRNGRRHRGNTFVHILYHGTVSDKVPVKIFVKIESSCTLRLMNGDEIMKWFWMNIFSWKNVCCWNW